MAEWEWYYFRSLSISSLSICGKLLNFKLCFCFKTAKNKRDLFLVCYSLTFFRPIRVRFSDTGKKNCTGRLFSLIFCSSLAWQTDLYSQLQHLFSLLSYQPVTVLHPILKDQLKMWCTLLPVFVPIQFQVPFLILAVRGSGGEDLSGNIFYWTNYYI